MKRKSSSHVLIPSSKRCKCGSAACGKRVTRPARCHAWVLLYASTTILRLPDFTSLPQVWVHTCGQIDDSRMHFGTVVGWVLLESLSFLDEASCPLDISFIADKRGTGGVKDGYYGRGLRGWRTDVCFGCCLPPPVDEKKVNACVCVHLAFDDRTQRAGPHEPYARAPVAQSAVDSSVDSEGNVSTSLC